MDFEALFRRAAESMEAELRAMEATRQMVKRMEWSAEAREKFTQGPWFVDETIPNRALRVHMVSVHALINRSKALQIHNNETVEGLLAAFEDL